MRLLGVLKPGSLLQLQGVGLSDNYFFLGCLLKKPQLHTLVRAFIMDSNEPDALVVTMLKDPTAPPTILTSRQLFLDLLQKDGSLREIHFCVHDYKLSPFEPLTKVCITSTDDCGYAFTQTRQNKKNQSANASSSVPLPFGLKEAPRKRKPKRHAGERKQRKKDRQGPNLGMASIEQEVELLVNNNGADEEVEISSSSSEGSSQAVLEDRENQQQEDREIEEEPFRTEEAEEEDRQVQLVLQSHWNLMDRRGSGPDVDLREKGPGEEDKADVSQLEPAQSSTSRPSRPAAAPAGVQCNSVVGIVEVGRQVASRLATCRQCNLKIAKGRVRLAYSFKVTKFHAWVHIECAAEYLAKQKANMRQACAFLDTESAKDHPQDMIDAVNKLRHELSRV